MILQLQGYDFDIEYRKGEQNISDCISLHPDQEQKLIESVVVGDKYVNFKISNAVPIAFILEDITTGTKQDKFLQILKQLYKTTNGSVWRRNNMM